MVVKKEITPINKIRKVLNAQNGILLTSDLTKIGVPRTYLGILVKNGEIQRISRGVYAAADTLVDEMVCIQARYKSAIFSHSTALYLLDLTDRTPLYYSVTVSSGYNASSLKTNDIKVYFVQRNLLSLGSITLKSPHGNDIQTYDLERTICDILRNRNQMDIQIVKKALNNYVIHKDRNINQLYYYAKQFNIHSVIRRYIEILL
jgi:predicted transcriptional regulator of viral defense system